MATTTSRQDADARETHFGYVIFIAAAAARGGLLLGYDRGVFNGGGPGTQRRFTVTSITPGLRGWKALRGSAAGAWMAGPAADRFGRVRVMLTAAALFF